MIVKNIIESVAGACGIQCHYQSVEQLNRLLDNAEFPCAYFFLLTQNTLNVDGGNLRERVQVAVFFVEPTEYDFAAVENEEIIERCKQRALQWVRSLWSNSYLRLIGVNNTQRVYDEMDVTLTGFAVNVTLEELKGIACE